MSGIESSTYSKPLVLGVVTLGSKYIGRCPIALTILTASVVTRYRGDGRNQDGKTAGDRIFPQSAPASHE